MYSESDTLAGGFPHSDISGSMLICQLPGAFRRLPRPSSPVIAKASTTCTYSLDPIALNPHARCRLRNTRPKAPSPSEQSCKCLPCAPLHPTCGCRARAIQSLTHSSPASSPVRLSPPLTCASRLRCEQRFTSSTLLKNTARTSEGTHQYRRTFSQRVAALMPDLWWSQSGSNR